ncbi:unnamed protein product [Lampetra planeri]
MSSAQQLLWSQRDLLLKWTCDHPAPLLRWLRDAEVLSLKHYLSLLEKSPYNAVAKALETVCATEEGSRGFLQVLREVQDYYCRDLQVWVERYCRRDSSTEPVPPPVQVDAPLKNVNLIVDKRESLQMFTRFFMGMLRARLTGQLDGLVDQPIERGDNIPAQLGLWCQDQFKSRKLTNQEALNLLHCLTELHIKEATRMAAPEIRVLNLFKMIVGNDIGEVGRQRLRELERHRPGLRIITNFVDDLGLLQAYLDWVEEIQADRDQMDSVKNADALQSVLKGLQVAGQVEGENAEKAKELEAKIVELLNC